MSFDFKQQLAIGEKAEAEFIKQYPKLARTDGRKGDLTAPNGDLIELKADTYSMDKTDNFFMERYSSIEKKSPGGPWQALGNQSRYFVYLYTHNQKAFWFETIMLVQFLDSHYNCFSKRSVKNVSWTGEGLLVPRTAIEHLSIEVPQCLR